MAHPIWGMEDGSEYSTVVIKKDENSPLPRKEEDAQIEAVQTTDNAQQANDIEEGYHKKGSLWGYTPTTKELKQWDRSSLEERVCDQAEQLDKTGRDIGAHLDTITKLKKENEDYETNLNTLQQQHQQLQQEKSSDENTIIALQDCNKEILAYAQSWPQTLANPKAYALPSVLIVAWIGMHYAPRFTGGKKVKRFLCLIGMQKRG